MLMAECSARKTWLSLGASGRVAVFGAGKHTAWLEQMVAGLAGPRVDVVLDDWPEGKRKVFGCKVVAPVEWTPKGVDAIVLSSDCHAASMRERCQDLYGDALPLIELYQGLPVGPTGCDISRSGAEPCPRTRHKPDRLT